MNAMSTLFAVRFATNEAGRFAVQKYLMVLNGNVALTKPAPREYDVTNFETSDARPHEVYVSLTNHGGPVDGNKLQRHLQNTIDRDVWVERLGQHEAPNPYEAIH